MKKTSKISVNIEEELILKTRDILSSLEWVVIVLEQECWRNSFGLVSTKQGLIMGLNRNSRETKDLSAITVEFSTRMQNKYRQRQPKQWT